MNKRASVEWLTIAFHDLQSAKILYDAHHYTDSIGNDLQQAIEKTLKALLAYKNLKIPKSHDLLELYELVKDSVSCEDDLILLVRASEYFKEDRYPNPSYSLPPREEIKEILDFSEHLFERVCDLLEIRKSDLL